MSSVVSILPGDLRPAMERLVACIRAHGPMAVACSGGVDSGLLAYVAHRALDGRMVCVLGVSDSLAASEEAGALEFFTAHGLPFVRVETHEMDSPGYRANGPDRCFFCKHELFQRIEGLPAAREFPVLAYGANADDRFDHRPGARAADAHRVCAPLAESGFTKDMVRSVARALGLKVWDKPASPCLASRIPYRSEVTPAKLRQIDEAETILKRHGFHVCRVRHHGTTALVEVPLGVIARLQSAPVWRDVEAGIRAAGFEHVDVDPRGFKSGRLNETLARPS